MPAITDVPDNQVGRVVQSFVNDGEDLIVAERSGPGLFTVTAGAAAGGVGFAPMAPHSAPAPAKKSTKPKNTKASSKKPRKKTP